MDKIKIKIKEYLLITVSFLKTKVFTKRNRKIISEFFCDFRVSIVNVMKGIKLPTKKGWRDFILKRLITTGTGWWVSVMATDLISNNFKYKNIKNRWGLKGRRDGKTMITLEEFEMYSWWAKFLIGLIVLITVRYIIMQTIKEYDKIRENKNAKENTSTNIKLQT